jgi:hypothetical protein
VLQIGWENEKSAITYFHHDLIGILGRKLHDRWPDDTGLISRVVKVYGVCAGVSSNVISATQEVIGVTMRPVCGTLGENIDPTAGNLESVTTYSQELQNAFRRVIYTGNKILKFFEFMQCPI